MPRVFSFEIPSDDPARAMAFYESVFGWTFQQSEGDGGWLCRTGDDDESGIDGGLIKRQVPFQPAVTTILVDNLDLYAVRIVEAGGEIISAKYPTAGGSVCYFKDLDGHVFGVSELAS